MYEVLFKHVLFPAYETFFKRRGTAAFIAEYERSQWLDRASLEELQLGKLNELLAHCWANVPFLKRYWHKHGMAPGPLGHLSELARFPLLTKALIRSNYSEMIATNWSGRTMRKSTSGSTGEPFSFEYTMEAYARRTAVMWRGYGWGGARLGTRTGYVWGTAGMRESGWGGIKDRLYHGAFNRRFFDAFSLATEEDIDGLIQQMIAYAPQAVVGYVGPLLLVARRMRSKGRSLGGLRGVLTAAETLYEHERQDMERAFGCPVFNTYGSREVMLMASECERHSGLHINADHLLLETLDDAGRPVEVGTSGDVAITDFYNFGMPLVRYLNGDRATQTKDACACGRGLPLLSSVDGRVFDSITTVDGRHVPGGYFSYLMINCPDVRQWQVVQTEIDCLQLRIVVTMPWTRERREELSAKLLQKTGPSMRVEIVEVKQIQTTASGKRRPVIPLPKTESSC